MLFRHNCNHGEDIGVRCTGNSSLLSNSIMNVSINNITSVISTHGINLYTIFITWKWQNNSMLQNQLNSFQIECFSDQHRVELSVNSTTLSVELLGLLHSTSYNCCVSAIYGSYTARAVCTETATIQPPTSRPSPMKDISSKNPISESSTIQPSTCQTQDSMRSFSASSSVADVIGGVQGFIIAILLILSAVLGVALVYLLRPKFFRNV